MENLIINGNNYYLPQSISDVQFLITKARQEKAEIRVTASAHSVPQSIYPDAGGAKPAIFVMMSYMRSVKFQQVTLNGVLTNQAVVEAGCNLGLDPFDPTNISTWENSLFMQMDQKGFAVPDMGGIIHQQIGGFLSTGSSGGSTTYSFDESIYSITFIPADSDNPQPVTVCMDDKNTDLFYAAGVSMGLLGIIVSVTINLISKFNITGSEVTTDDIASDGFDFLGNRNDPSLLTFQEFLEQTEYTRVMWYPQNGIRKLTVWKAAQDKPGTPFTRNPYWEFGPTDTSSFISQFGIDMFYTLAGTWPEWWDDIFGSGKQFTPVEQLVLDGAKVVIPKIYYPEILPKLINTFVPNTTPTTTKPFQDYWYSSLPMDNNVSDKIMHVEFTELWIDISQTGAVMTALNDLFAQYYAGTLPGHPGCPGGEGSFATEIYAAKKSNFWMSPSYGYDVVRIDVFWWANNKGLPTDTFYPMFWKALAPFNYRCHWGKYMPPGNDPDVGVPYRKAQYPNWDKFMAFRSQYDPLEVFVNDYWRGNLGL